MNTIKTLNKLPLLIVLICIQAVYASAFPEHEDIPHEFIEGLKLGDVPFAEGNYVWNEPEMELTAGINQIFAATYTCPSGKYSPVTGNITVNVLKKAAFAFPIHQAIEVTYSPNLTLADLTLNADYVWDLSSTLLLAGVNQTFKATYTCPSGKYMPVTGNIRVNVKKTTDVTSIH